MFNVDYVFELEEGTEIQTIGANVTGYSVARRDYITSECVDDETGDVVPTFIVEGQTGEFTFRQVYWGNNENNTRRHLTTDTNNYN